MLVSVPRGARRSARLSSDSFGSLAAHKRRWPVEGYVVGVGTEPLYSWHDRCRPDSREGVPFRDVEPASGCGREGIFRLTRIAAGALGSAVRLGWSLEEGRWLLVSVVEDPGQQT